MAPEANYKMASSLAEGVNEDLRWEQRGNKDLQGGESNQPYQMVEVEIKDRVRRVPLLSKWRPRETPVGSHSAA